MSSNRSVQAAQRRRSGAPEPQRVTPQPSINSAQMFANQSRNSQGSTPPHLTTQHVNMQQSTETISSVNKMTIPQAITLITLRLGAVESKLLNFDESQISANMHSMDMEGNENMVLIDKSIIATLDSRLESLEKRNASTSNQELLMIKQQFETVKQTIIQTKNATVAVVKENKDLKTQMEVLKKELNETKDLLLILQNLTMDNNQKILTLSMGVDFENNLGEIDVDNYDELEKVQEVNQSYNDSDSEDDNENIVIGTTLKQIIESEINADMNGNI